MKKEGEQKTNGTKGGKNWKEPGKWMEGRTRLEARLQGGHVRVCDGVARVHAHHKGRLKVLRLERKNKKSTVFRSQ